MKLDALEHPKTYDFASHLGVSRPTALGHLELLWAFVAKQSPQGNVGKWPDGAIARACDWMGDPQCFLQSLLQSGFIDKHPDHRYVIHDWHEHAPRWVRAKLAKLNLSFIVTIVRTVVPTVVGTSLDGDDDDHGYVPTVDATAVRTTEASSKGRVSKSKEEKDSPLPPQAEGDQVGSDGVEKNGAGPPERKRLSESVDRVFEHWRNEHNHPGAQLEAKRGKLIRDALAMGYSEADLCQAISGYKNSPHHMGVNPTNTVYDSIELMLRDAKHIDAGMRFYREPPRTDLSEQTRRIIDQTAGWTPPEVRNATR